jgi:hypothetical protein
MFTLVNKLLSGLQPGQSVELFPGVRVEMLRCKTPTIKVQAGSASRKYVLAPPVSGRVISTAKARARDIELQ